MTISWISILLCTILLFNFICFALAVPDVSFVLNSDYTATISVNGFTWLQTGATWFHAFNQTFSTADNSLTLSSSRERLGSDSLGLFNATSLTWTTSSSPFLTFITTYRVYSYSTSPPAIKSIVFEQVWVTRAEGTSVGNSDDILSSFPSFLPQRATTTLGALQWGNGFATNKVFVYNGEGASLPLVRGGVSGPLVLFDKTGMSSAVISAYSSFMSTSSVASKNGTIEWGVVGSITAIPAGYTAETIVVFDDRGFTQGVLTWGDALLTRYNKRREAYLDEFITQYLGYSTDGGAYYYYHTEEGMNYEQTLQAVNNDAIQRHIPYRHMFLDSWWYYKGASSPGVGGGGGVKNWTARPDVFPSGLQALHSNLTYPFVAHNKWWSNDTDYARQNGGQYDFVFGNNFGLPISQIFWDDLMRNASVWGLKIYQQDWLLTVWDSLPQIKEDVTLGRRWLIQMGQGAAKAGINIQYCMPYPRHLLQSVEIPNVVQSRSSTDNTPGSTLNWIVGESDLLLYSIGVSPYKDDFWTTSVQPNNTYNATEPAPALNAVIATLSTGSVYPGDKIGYTDIPLLARSHRSDGLLLKGDRPAFSLDSSYVYRAFGGNTGPDAKQITHTYTELLGMTYHVVLVAQESHEYPLPLSELYLSEDSEYFAYFYHNSTISLPKLIPFNQASPLILSPNSVREAFTVFYASPLLSNGMVIIGEPSKWVPVSRGRVEWMSVDEDGARVALMGGPMETITWWWAVQNGRKTVNADCTMNEEGRAIMTIPADGLAAICSVL